MKVAIGISTPTLYDERFKKCYDLLKKNTTGYFYEIIIFEGLAPKGEMFHYTRATNTLFKAITDADYYVVINSDVFVEPHWLEPLIETAEQDPNIGIVGVMTTLSNDIEKHNGRAGLVQHGGGTILWNGSRVKLVPTHIGVLTKPEDNMQQRDCMFVTGCLSLFTKRCIETIGMKDENIYAGFEDIEYCIRAWENNLRVVYQPKSRATHDAGTFNAENKDYNLDNIYYDQTWEVLKDRWNRADIEILEKKVSDSNKKHYLNLKEAPKREYRNLVITTGYNRILINRWLPLLRKKGKYKGDVLIVDYGTIKYGVEPDQDKESLEELRKQPNVFICSAKKQLANIFIDRVRVYREWLLENERYKNYDVIMIVDGNDIIFHGSIDPLLQMGYERICYVTEHFSNKLKLWGDFSSRKFIQDTPKYKAIENKPIINGGMVIGPTGYMMNLLNYQNDMIKQYGDGPSDQLLLCLYIYADKFVPAFEVGQEWNYTYAVIGTDDNGKHYGPRQAIFVNGKAYKRENNDPIIIEHRTGTGYWFWRSKEALEILNSKRDISITEEYDKGTNYFALHFPNTPEFLPEDRIDKFKIVEDKNIKPTKYIKPVSKVSKKQLKTLILTTGCNKIILSRWLKTLRENGKFTGDVAVLNYGTTRYGEAHEEDNKELVEELLKQPNVKVFNQEKKLRNIFIDRARAYREYLLKDNLWKNYEVIMIVDGNDVIFHRDINPLLEIAKSKFCYVKEHPSNKLRLWNDYFIRSFIKNSFKGLDNNTIINGGMIVGKSEYLMDVLNRQMELVEQYGDGPSDQLYLNLIIYYEKYKHAYEVDKEWNYTHAVIGQENGVGLGPRRAVFRDGKAYTVEDDKLINIEHRTGTGFFFWTSAIGTALLKSSTPISITAEYEVLNYGKPIGTKTEPRVSKGNWLFPKGTT